MRLRLRPRDPQGQHTQQWPKQASGTGQKHGRDWWESYAGLGPWKTFSPGVPNVSQPHQAWSERVELKPEL